jgi:1,5-anhydro-D-fructose reductase (1,5-anhydro-D-mannitol-forming)
MIRYGILGFGLHAVKRLMPGFAQAKHCTVTGIWRRDRQKAQDAMRQYRQFPLRVYDSPEALCSSSDIDAIFVASPDALHLEHALIAVKHNKPVLCEKPMAMSVGECERMIEAADRQGVLLGIAQNFRFERSVNRMREMVATAAIGKALLAQSEFHYPALHSPRTWIADASLACGGPIGDVAVHCIDALRYILQDEVASIFARALHDEDSGRLESAGMLLLEFQKGTIANVTVSARSEYRTPLWITGDRGLAGAEDALTVEHPITLQLKTAGREPVTEQVSNESAYADQVDAFALSIEQGIPFAAPGIEGLRNQRALDAAYKSIQSGMPQKL